MPDDAKRPESGPKLPSFADDHDTVVRVVVVDKTILSAALGIFLILATAALYFAQDFLLPVSLAFLFALVLSPIVRTFAKSGVPEPATAAALILAVCALLGVGAYFLSGPITQWVADAPRISQQVQAKIAVLQRPIQAVFEASARIDGLTRTDDPMIQTVILREPGLLSRAATGVPEMMAKTALTLVLMFFLLAAGAMFQEKLVKVLPTLSDKKKGLRIARDVEQVVSRYLFTISVINVALGMAITACMYAIGMPNPVLWGVAGAVLNFIPYLGAFVGIALVGVIGLVAFDTVGQALMAPALYAVCTTIEGQFVTPMVVGRRLEMNAVAIFIAVAFWGWLWGIVGALIAVPMLVVAKVFSDHVDSLSAVGQFLAARDVPQSGEHAEAGTREKA